MTTNNRLYYTYSNYLKNLYNDKVYKLPVNLPVTCPNRIDGAGCSFCAEVGTGFEMLSNTIEVKEQLLKNRDYIKNKYKANKFIAYFQNYTNTFLPLEDFKKYVKEALIEDVVEIAISTRPDCIREDYLEFLSTLKKEKGINITIELGLQTVNYHTLQKIKRGHTLGEYIDAVLKIKMYEFKICTHLILNLPEDNEDDAKESAKILSALGIDYVKLHSLYVAKNTEMAYLYENNKISLCSKNEYIERVILFLEYLNPNISIQRLLGRAPNEETIFCNWDTSWWKIKDEIELIMNKRGTYQGKKYNYLNGSGLRKGCY
ncbi:hypothetical protein EDC18_104107 [Natranaerovirga pectinivora]|uniref:Radical SAM core domain-containing protein n=1 Tax=Natranaerovirga pectinivora TaxID=682400 RepID=A0A4R3MK63_9FIRM|nr:TIGR01212 family radical SAM protein [Natranaerovirga pectinivora]TCT14957.1 hypothetical protein EDC18_104107 [Natranaerovirga pectinivora]